MSAVPPRLTVVTLGARDIAKLRAFYEGLGFPKTVEAPDGFCAFLLNGVVLGLYPLASLTAEAAPGLQANGEWSGVTLAMNVATRDEVDRAFAAVVTAGATVVAGPVDRDWGGRTGYFADPEGNRWEIAWAPGLELDERGAVRKFGEGDDSEATEGEQSVESTHSGKDA
jgi:catechol 2,3-dioxygenase-like lactoylglutathione lyase family enzyme